MTGMGWSSGDLNTPDKICPLNVTLLVLGPLAAGVISTNTLPIKFPLGSNFTTDIQVSISFVYSTDALDLRGW